MENLNQKIKILALLCAFFVVVAVVASFYTLSRPPAGVPILAYHMVNDKNDKYSISPSDFADHLQYLKDSGYTTISLLEFAKAKKGKFTLPEKPLIITFDDGYEDNYTTALPLLERYGMKATVFMVVNDIGKEGYLTLDQLKDMEKRQIELGSHTANHLPLATLSPDKQKEEIALSKLLMEWKGLNTVFFLAYPNGSYDKECQDILANNNYLGALTGKAGLNTAQTNPYILHRINVPKPTFGITELKLRIFKAELYTKLGIMQH